MVDIGYLDLDGTRRQVKVFRRQNGDGSLFDSLGCKSSPVDMGTGNADE